MRHRVVLVRGARSAGGGGGGGCCSGDVRPFDEGGGHGGEHCHDRPDDEAAVIYRALRAALPDDVDVEIVAPSNWVFLLPELLRGGRRRGLHGPALGRSVRSGIAVSSLLVDGVPVSSGGFPSPAAAVDLVRARLALA
jgi:hypothetical protein